MLGSSKIQTQRQVGGGGLRWCLAPDFTPAAKASSTRTDALICLLLALWGSAFYFTGLGVLEFFRHTEADRTLIGWEMFKSGEYIVPHLLEAVILTKPPLFYWLVAIAIDLAGTAAEWAPRLPSASAALALLVAQYLFLRKAGCTSTIALFGALMTGTGGALFVLCGAAEIDMVFCFFCMLALYGMFFSTRKPASGVVLSYVMAAAAFLAKGPPVVLFYGAAFVVFVLWRLFFAGAEEQGDARRRFWYLMQQHVWGVLTFAAIVGLWLLALGSKVGFDVLGYELQEEVVNRVVRISTRDRGPFFYFGSLGTGLAPWTPLLVIGLLAPFFSKFSFRYKELKTNDAYWPFFVFNVIVVLTAFLMLSMAEGKSNRYIFPVYPFAMNLALFGWLHIRGTNVGRWLVWGSMVFVAHVAGAALMLPFWSKFEMVSMESRLITTALVFAGSLSVVLAMKFRPVAKVLFPALLLFLFSLRFGYTHIFVESRNIKRSVKHVAAQLNDAIPKAEKLYTLEMFERWVVYYMMRDDRAVARLTPEKATSLAQETGEVYLLLQVEQEAWRLKQLAKFGASPELVLDVQETRDPLYLVKVPKAALGQLTLSRRAPTEASQVPEEFIEVR